MATREQLMGALRAADAAGDMEGAKRIAVMLQAAPAVQAVAQQAPPQTIMAQRALSQGAEPIPDPVDVSKGPRVLPKELEGLPELHESGLLSGQSKLKVAAISPALLTTTDPNEIAQIITSNFPAIGLTHNKDESGNLFPVLTNNETGAATPINKPGISGIDIVQGLGLAAAFTPAARAGSVLGAGAKSAGTQAGIETAQLASGGEFDVAPIAMVGAFGAGAQKAGQVASKYFSQQSPTKQKITELIEQNSDDVQRAGFELKQTATGAKPVKIKAAKAASTQGVDDGVISLIQSSSKSDRQSMLRAIDTLKKARKSKTFAISNRPGDAAGGTLKSRYDAVKSINSQAGKDVSKSAQSLKGTEVDLSSAYDGFIDELLDAGVSITRGKNGNLKGSYGNSEFAMAKSSQKILDDFIAKSEKGAIDALDAHRLKRVISGAVEFGQKQKNPILGKAESSLKTLRRGINENLQGISPAYKAANTKFSETRGVLDEFSRVAGPNFNPASDSASKQLVNVARSLMSNNQKRVPALESINALQEVSKKYGIVFDDDILKQAAFMDELERMFGSSAPTSFGGQIDRSAERAIEGGMASLARDAAKEGIKKVRGINEENLIKSLEELLR